MKLKFGVLGLSLLMTGCTTLGGGTGTLTPKSISAPANPVQPINTGISGGGLVGGEFGAKLVKADKQIALNAEYKALEYGKGSEAIDWTGSTGTVGGKVIAGQPYRVGSQDCRQYSHTITTAGVDQSARGTACRNPDGTWTLLQ
jgi:surface antigen